MKRKSSKRRSRIDGRIASAKSEAERIHLAMHGHTGPPKDVQTLVALFGLFFFRTLEKPGPRIITENFPSDDEVQKIQKEFLNLLTRLSLEFMVRAMNRWNADAFIALGEEMKRCAAQEKRKGFHLARVRRTMLAKGISAYQAARSICEQLNIKSKDQIESEENRLKKIKRRWRKRGCR